MLWRIIPSLAGLGLAFLLRTASSSTAAPLDLTTAVVVLPDAATPLERQAAAMLIEEVEKRSRIRWAQVGQWPTESGPVISMGSLRALQTAGGAWAESVQGLSTGPAEGFHLRVRNENHATALVLAGQDPRGVLFGVGRLLRELRMTRDNVEVADDLSISTAPATRLRGHQLGYRPKTNSYDAWDVAEWEQYIQDLVVFGCNAIELIPPRSDDAADSPHFPRPPMPMMIEMSRLADRYGLDVWIWYPALDTDYSDTRTVQTAVAEWGAVFQRLPRIDAVFVPGGDPGHTQPGPLMQLLKRQAENLHQFHPAAQMWVSPQGFNRDWLEEFVTLLRTEQPAWLDGIVFGPQVRVPLPQLRELVPARYPIRDYPDITHSRQCQYPMPEWDRAFAMTEARECINPRPLGQAAIFRATTGYTTGFITYSEGCNDDVNKAVWSALGWNPAASVTDVLRDYSRYFIGASVADEFAHGLLSLEQNWQGPLASNPGVLTTLQQFQALEHAATPAQLRNWRFQQALFRAYYDAYLYRRLLYETGLEQLACESLRRADERGSLSAMAAAEQQLNQNPIAAPASAWRERIHELSAALFQSIGMQLSVPKYQAIAIDRGACLDTLDFPLNNRVWLMAQFNRIRQVNSETERLEALRQILDWENPGPGGFYDDLGNSARQPHLVQGQEFDPGFMRSPRSGFAGELTTGENLPPQGPRRVSWLDHAETLYDTPLAVSYTHLDPESLYKVRVVYAGDSPKRQIRLVANNTIEIHPLITKPTPFAPVEFDLPHAATASGTLSLTWFGEPGLGGNGRGCQVSEVWLCKRQRNKR